MPYHGIAEWLTTACMAVGATLGGMASQLLKAVAASTQKAMEMIQRTKQHIDVTLFTASAGTFKDLRTDKALTHRER